ncbi:ash family protein [Gallibacterium anatis]|uniref:ash family protein n=1 Tax=Gallibacterium anatis TaxID=750 RepID=UPI003006A3BF
MINNKKSYCFALKTENNINLYLTKKHKPRYFTNAFAKSKASRSKLNIQKANSTPKRAFFVRRFHTPKENRLAVILSMMACSGQPFAVGCFPFEAVCYPATRYRQSVASLAIALEQLSKGLLAMIYQFKAVSRFDLRNTQKPISLFPRYTLKINAETLSQAVAKVSPFFVVLNVYNTGKNGINTFHKLAK